MNLLGSRVGRRVLFTGLYMSEGAPIGFIWWALPTKLRTAGVEVGDITLLTSLLVLPWVFKFIWSPLIDGVRTARWTLRSWILAAQLLAGLALLPLLFYDAGVGYRVLVPFLLLSTIAAATQDAAIDALAISAVPSSERGSLNGWMQAGMLAGRSALGGGALLLDRSIGPGGVVLVLIAVLWSSSVLVLLSKEVPNSEGAYRDVRERLHDVFRRLKTAGRSRVTWLGLMVAAVAGAGFEGVGAVAGPFLIDGGWSQEDVGTFFAFHAVVAMALGALIGGGLADRLHPSRATSSTLLILSGVIVLLAGVTWAFPEAETEVLLPAMTLLYGCIGAFTASSYALFMDITDARLGATQFSAFMGASNGCESWAGFAAGALVAPAGYGGAFVVLAMVSLVALPAVRRLGPGRGPADPPGIPLSAPSGESLR